MTTTNLSNLGVLGDWCEENLPECTTWVRGEMDIWCNKYTHYFELIQHNAPRDLLYAAVRELADRRELIRTNPVTLTVNDINSSSYAYVKQTLRPQHPCWLVLVDKVTGKFSRYYWSTDEVASWDDKSSVVKGPYKWNDYIYVKLLVEAYNFER